MKTDFLVLGGGIAGLSFALKVAKYGTVTILSKKKLGDTSTAWAQGGVAAVTTKDDSYELHIEDTIKAGAGLSDRKIVEIVVHEGPERVQELISWGANFDKEGTSFHLSREGGHSKRRIFHFGDATGATIQKVLTDKIKQEKNITVLEGHHAVDLITTKKVNKSDHNKVIGVYVLCPDGTVKPFLAKSVMVATGGAGKVYLYTSNPDVASGDGLAMCSRAGCEVKDLEFMQFHPTCLYHPKAKAFLITEAMRGEGAILKRKNGENFMYKYHPDAELAPRDVVARAIDNEMKLYGEDCVFLDISHKPESLIKEHFPNIYEKCLSLGIDITKEPIPVVPAAHYMCGGVKCNEYGETKIEGLYVAGEVACTGLHGGNRLASNSLLEGMVFGHRAAIKAADYINTVEFPLQVLSWDTGKAIPSDEAVVVTQNWDEVRRTMWNYVGIVRTQKRLERAEARIALIEKETLKYYWDYLVTSDLLELRNLTLVAKLIIRAAMNRKESAGLHYVVGE